MKMVMAVLLVAGALEAAVVHAAVGQEGKSATPASTTLLAKNKADAAALLPVISNAWISEAPPVARNNAAFVTVKNGARQDVLLGVETPAAETAEFHQMSMAGGIMRMLYLPVITLAPHAVLAFAPGGRHIMLINMKQPLKAGDTVPLTLKFRNAGTITVQAEVRALVPETDATDHGSHAGH
jgi:hypothetical protein